VKEAVEHAEEWIAAVSEPAPPAEG